LRAGKFEKGRWGEWVSMRAWD